MFNYQQGEFYVDVRYIDAINGCRNNQKYNIAVSVD